MSVKSCFVLLLVAGILLFGCLGGTSQAEEQIDASKEAVDGGQDDLSQPTALPSADVLMLGRSVTEGWADFMGLRFNDELGGFAGSYQGRVFWAIHLETPPELPNSVDEILERNSGRAKTVVFKLCFEDFNPSEDNAQMNEEFVQRAYAATSRHGQKLVVINALPQVAAFNEEGIRANHLTYNAWLQDFASSHQGVCIVDVYSILADADGSLKEEYAAGEEDSHWNRAAYQAVTPLLLQAIAKCA